MQTGPTSSQIQHGESNGMKQPQPGSADGRPSMQSATPAAASQAEIRRFHMFRQAGTISTSSTAGKKRGAHIFVERRIRKTQKISADATPSLPEEPIRTQKKPGASARIAQKPAPTSPQPTLPPTQRLPSALVNPWGVKEDELAAQMQAYTLQEIGRSIAESNPEAPPADRVYKVAQGRYKPKKPVQRYHERNPGTGIPGPAMEEFEEDVDMDEDEYIIDTYIRMPAEELDSQEGKRKFGLLVLESQPDIDEFYRDETDSDSEEEFEGDEDENGQSPSFSTRFISAKWKLRHHQAENHYSADYPDEEVSSDDEHGRNPYAYRKGIEEFNDQSDDSDYVGSEDGGRACHRWMGDY